MVDLHPRFIINENQERTGVFLSIADWEWILEELEDLEDIRAYDEAKSGSQEAIPSEQAMREIELSIQQDMNHQSFEFEI